MATRDVVQDLRVSVQDWVDEADGGFAGCGTFFIELCYTTLAVFRKENGGEMGG